MNGNAPPMGNSSGMPPVGGQSPAQNALALAQAEKAAAEQKVTTAQSTLESAQSAVQTAQQTLTTAQETLASATSALQEAENAVEAENQQKAELIRVAEQAVQEAEQNLQTAQQELDSARSALQELEQQIATAQGTVTTAESKTNEAVKTVNDAKAELARLMGNSSGMPPIGSQPLEYSSDFTSDIGARFATLPPNFNEREAFAIEKIVTTYIMEREGDIPRIEWSRRSIAPEQEVIRRQIVQTANLIRKVFLSGYECNVNDRRFCDGAARHIADTILNDIIPRTPGAARHDEIDPKFLDPASRAGCAIKGCVP